MSIKSADNVNLSANRVKACDQRGFEVMTLQNSGHDSQPCANIKSSVSFLRCLFRFYQFVSFFRIYPRNGAERNKLNEFDDSPRSPFTAFSESGLQNYPLIPPLSSIDTSHCFLWIKPLFPSLSNKFIVDKEILC